MSMLVLLHGFAGGPWSFDGVLNHCAPRETLRPTLSYHDPEASLPPTRWGFGDEVARLTALIQSTTAVPVDLVGYSMGGRLALGIAATQQDLVRHLILISSRRGLDSEEARQQRRKADDGWASMLETEGLHTFLARFWSQPLFDSLRRAPPLARELELERRSKHHPIGLAAALRQLGLGNQPSYAAQVRDLAIPVTVVAGDLDQKFLELSKELVSDLPLGRLVVVKGAGHQLLLEAPTEVARIIDEEIHRSGSDH